jgi:hypothetical protein
VDKKRELDSSENVYVHSLAHNGIKIVAIRPCISNGSRYLLDWRSLCALMSQKDTIDGVRFRLLFIGDTLLSPIGIVLLPFYLGPIYSV